MFNLAYWELRDRRVPLAIDTQRLLQAIALYKAAGDYGDHTGHAHAERFALMSLPIILENCGMHGRVTPEMLGISRREADAAFQGLPELVKEYAALQCAVLQEDTEPRPAPPWQTTGDPAIHAEPHSSEAVRQLAVLAYTLGDAATALYAASLLEGRGEADGFISAVLGVLHLANDNPSLAYPRLRIAMQAFPEEPGIALFTAEAAARCGDPVMAARYLGLAEAAGTQDGYAVHRVRTLMRLHAGEVDPVLEEIRTGYCVSASLTPILVLQVVKQLESLNRPSDEIIEFATLSNLGIPRPVRCLRFFRQRADPWWDSQSAGVREDLLRRMLVRDQGECDWRDIFLSRAVEAESLVSREQASQHVAGGSLSAVCRRWLALPQALRDTDAARAGAWIPEQRRALERWLLSGEGAAPAVR